MDHENPIVAFLKARYDEDEHAACAQTPGVFVATAPRTIRDIAAKRKILDEYEDTVRWYDQHKTAPAGEVHGLWKAVKLLAEPYSDHEDYASAVNPVTP